MKQSKWELLLGAGLGVLAYLAIRGVNLLPGLLLLGLAYFLVISKGQIGTLGRKKVGAVMSKRPDVTFGDVGGQAVAKRELVEALEFLKKSEEAKRLGIRPLKGILLSGPPGTGKTLLAKAAANYTQSAFVAASGSEFIEVYAGLGAQRVRDLFSRARQLAKEESRSGAIIFLDEVEVLAGRRGTQVGHLEYDQTLNQLLVEMDGLQQDDDVRILLIGATNRPDLLDPALGRPGRFDRQVKVDLPDRDGRLEILKLHLRGKPLAPGVDVDRLARETFGLSGAHLESLCNEAAILALRKGESAVGPEDLGEALDKVIMGEKLDRRPSKTELLRVSYHEAGHALVTEAMRPGTVSQITVTPRGSALGYVRHHPQDDVYIYPVETLEDEITILVSGAVSEEIMLGSKSSGASNDFERALALAKKIVAYGMSPLGIVDKDTASPESLGQATRGILDKCMAKSESLLRRNLDALAKVAAVLCRHERISGDHLRRILGRTLTQGEPKAGVEALGSG